MFSFSNDKRIMYILIIIMVIRRLSYYAGNDGALLGLILTIPGLIIAITFHEFAHAYSADKLGDDTPRMEGRLSLNPLAHLDPVGSLLLLFAGFGWGKPVHVNPRNYTRKMSMEKADAIVSLAGPLMNFVLAFIFSLVYGLIYKFAYNSFVVTTAGNIVMIVLDIIVSINIGLGAFNLIPLPPLDGSKIIMPLLPQKAKQFFINNEQIFYIIFVVIWLTPLSSYIISKPIEFITSGIYNFTQLILGIPK